MLKSSLFRSLRTGTSFTRLKSSVSHDSKSIAALTTIAELARKAEGDETIEVRGWVKRVSKTGGVVFAHISDGLSTDTVQVVIPRSVATSIPLGSAIRARGQWRQSAGSQQACELTATEASVLAKDSDPRYGSLNADQLRKMIPLRARSDSFAAVLRLRSRLVAETHRFFQDSHFVYIDTPILTANDCEGAGETFTVQCGMEPTTSSESSSSSTSFFGHDVFLSVSSQLHLEAVTAGISHVYTIARAFRAEKNQSSTHMSEFSMIEVEVAFCEDLDEMMDLVERYVRSMATALLGDADADQEDADLRALTPFSDMTRTLVSSLTASTRIPRVRHADALEILREIGHKLPPSGSLSRSAELALVDHFKGPVFVTHFPSAHKPFYMRRNDEGETESFDLLCPFVGELAGGSLRVPTALQMEQQCSDGKLPHALQWYAGIRDRGKPPSGGFGIGFERLIQTLLEIRNIKDTTAFPRWLKQCKC